MSNADTIRGINPSGKRAIDEMREYAAHLPEHIGPFFGRDVVRMLNDLEAENQRLRDALAEFFAEYDRDDPEYLDLSESNVDEMRAALDQSQVTT